MLVRVSLTQKEAKWLTRNVVKTRQILENASKKDPEILERKTYKTLTAIESAVTGLSAEAEQVDVMLSRKQKKTVGTLVLQTMLVLEEKIIPEYTKRNLTEYLEDAKIKAQLLKSLYRKLR